MNDDCECSAKLGKASLYLYQPALANCIGQAKRCRVIAGKHRFRLDRLLDDACRMWQQGATILVQDQSSPDAVENLNPKRDLQLGQRIACCGLRSSYLARSRMRRPAPRDGRKHFQLANR